MEKSRRVLITGARRGIGQAIHDTLAHIDGYQIIAPTRQEMDLSKRDSVESYMRNSPPVDILINNAGINALRFVDEVCYDIYDQMMAVNLCSPLFLSKFVVRKKPMQTGR